MNKTIAGLVACLYLAGLDSIHPAPADLDLTFSDDGWVTVDFSGSFDEISEIAIQADGKIVAAGTASAGTNEQFAVARSLVDGTLDPSFSGDGIASTEMGFQGDGKIAVVGCTAEYLVEDGVDQISVARYFPKGNLDTSFAGDGKQYIEVGPGYHHATGVAIQPDGKIVIGGTAENSAGWDVFVCVRLNVNGTLDSTFSNDGKVSVAVGSGHSHCTALNVVDEKILLSGNAVLGLSISRWFD